MNVRDVSAWAGKWTMAAAMMASVALCGCESEDTDSDITTTRFSVERELRNYTSTDQYSWNTTLTEALVTVDIDDFTEGDTTLRVYDGNGVLVLSAALNTANNVYFTGSDLYYQNRTESGAAGQWLVVLGYNDFTGDIDITME
jgi:hypothetical protein